MLRPTKGEIRLGLTLVCIFYMGESVKLRQDTHQGSLTEGTAQYSCPPFTNSLKLPPFKFENFNKLLNKTSYLDEEVNCTKLSPSVSIPCTNLLRFIVLLTGVKSFKVQLFAFIFQNLCRV